MSIDIFKYIQLNMLLLLSSGIRDGLLYGKNYLYPNYVNPTQMIYKTSGWKNHTLTLTLQHIRCTLRVEENKGHYLES